MSAAVTQEVKQELHPQDVIPTPPKPTMKNVSLQVYSKKSSSVQDIPATTMHFTHSITVGRNSPFVAQHKPAKTVSKRQFQIVFDEMLGVYWLVNLSKNGTLVRESKTGAEVLATWEPLKLLHDDSFSVLLPLLPQQQQTHGIESQDTLELRFQL